MVSNSAQSSPKFKRAIRLVNSRAASWPALRGDCLADRGAPWFLTLPPPSRRISPALVDRDRHDVGVIARAAIECPDIEAGGSARNAHECHRGAAFGAISTLNGGERKAALRVRVQVHNSLLSAVLQERPQLNRDD